MASVYDTPSRAASGMRRLTERFGQISEGGAPASRSDRVSVAFVYQITIDDLAAFLYASRSAIRHCGMVADEQSQVRPRLREARGRMHQMESRRIGTSPFDFSALVAAVERLLGEQDGVADRLCQEVDALTRQRALLRLHPVRRARSIRSEVAAGACLHPVEFAGQIPGDLSDARWRPDLDTAFVICRRRRSWHGHASERHYWTERLGVRRHHLACDARRRARPSLRLPIAARGSSA